MITRQQILDELREKELPNNSQVKTRYSIHEEEEEYSLNREKLKEHANNLFAEQRLR